MRRPSSPTSPRLLIDANRGEDDPTLIMRISDGTIIPGNARVSAAERALRIGTLHTPYQAAIAAAVDRALAAGRPPMLVSIHSFTPIWRDKPRPWHAGVLSDVDRRLATALLDALRADPALVVGDNEPYAGGLANDTMDRHGQQRGLANAIIEIRQDLIADDAGIAGWVARLAPVLGGGQPDRRSPRRRPPRVKSGAAERSRASARSRCIPAFPSIPSLTILALPGRAQLLPRRLGLSDRRVTRNTTAWMPPPLPATN